VRDRFFELLEARGGGIRLAVFFMGASPAVDLAGAELLCEVGQALRARGVAFRVAEAHGEVRESLRRAGFERHVGPVVANQPVASAVAEWRADA
jgi:MFS superfamily sulfate permease-like transporter